MYIVAYLLDTQCRMPSISELINERHVRNSSYSMYTLMRMIADSDPHRTVGRHLHTVHVERYIHS